VLKRLMSVSGKREGETPHIACAKAALTDGELGKVAARALGKPHNNEIGDAIGHSGILCELLADVHGQLHAVRVVDRARAISE